MGKTYIDSVKYEIIAGFKVDGVVEKPDVVGAIFGQTEGLLGEELELRDLQKNGRIGRIEVELTSNKNVTQGKIIVPSSLDSTETCIVAAALETVDRVGPCEAKIWVERIVDRREYKREFIMKRAKELFQEFLKKEMPDIKEMVNKIREEVKINELVEYGEDHLAAGPGIESNDVVILVEGRADVINLLRNDINNVIEIGGLNIPKTIIDLCEKKEAIAFLDGDRGGDMILEALLRSGASVDYVARAPSGKEVEELTRKEIIKALRNKVPITPNDHYHEEFKKLRGSLKAKLFNEKEEEIKEIPVREIIKTLERTSGVKVVVFDGVVTQRLLDVAAAKGIEKIYGAKMGHVSKIPEKIEIHTEE